MHKLNIHRTGLAVGTFFGLVHAVWAVVVGMGFAQSKLDFLYGMHFISVPVEILDFSWGGALGLVVMALVAGYIIGSVFSFVWNKVAVR